MVFGIDRANGPGKGGEDQGERSERIDALGAAKVPGADQKSHACKTEKEAGNDARCWTSSAGA